MCNRSEATGTDGHGQAKDGNRYPTIWPFDTNSA